MKEAVPSFNQRIIAGIFYAILFLFAAYYVFVANDESQPLVEIFRLNYLIPVIIYASVATMTSIILFLMLRKILPNIVALVLSIIGLPVGILLIGRFFMFITNI